MSQGCALLILRSKGQRSRSWCMVIWKWFPDDNWLCNQPMIMKLHTLTPHEFVGVGGGPVLLQQYFQYAFLCCPYMLPLLLHLVGDWFAIDQGLVGSLMDTCLWLDVIDWQQVGDRWPTDCRPVTLTIQRISQWLFPGRLATSQGLLTVLLSLPQFQGQVTFCCIHTIASSKQPPCTFLFCLDRRTRHQSEWRTETKA